MVDCYESMKQLLEKTYKATKDPEITNKHVKLYQDAYKNRDLLKGGYPDLTDEYSAIEVLADGEPVGNTMMYMAHVNGELSLVLDDIELQGKYQNNDKIRDMIVKYSKQVCKEIGKPDITVYAGPGMHKVDMSDYPKIENAEMIILGETPQNGAVYLDFDAEKHDIGDVIEKLDLYKIS